MYYQNDILYYKNKMAAAATACSWATSQETLSKESGFFTFQSCCVLVPERTTGILSTCGWLLSTLTANFVAKLWPACSTLFPADGCFGHILALKIRTSFSALLFSLQNELQSAEPVVHHFCLPSPTHSVLIGRLKIDMNEVCSCLKRTGFLHMTWLSALFWLKNSFTGCIFRLALISCLKSLN